MEKFITARTTPKAATTAASRHARRRARPDSALPSGRAPMTAITAADIHSRSPVTAAGATWLNRRAASPAPNWTEKMPVTTSAVGGIAVSGARRAAGRPGGSRHFPVSTSRLLPAEQPRGQRDADRGPDDQHRQVTGGQPGPVLQDGVQPVRQ